MRHDKDSRHPYRTAGLFDGPATDRPWHDDPVGHEDAAAATPRIGGLAEGTNILTPLGECPVEMLEPGDHVITRDSGPCAIRWIGVHHHDGSDSTPIVSLMSQSTISQSTGPDRRPLVLARDHRVLFAGERAADLFGTPEVLVPAGSVGHDGTWSLGPRLRPADAQPRRLFILMFDRHELIFAGGLACETFLPDAAGLAGLDASARAVAMALLPGPHVRGAPICPPVRRCLTPEEAKILSDPAFSWGGFGI